MLTSKKDLSSQTATITLEHSDVNELLETEWLLTNSRGGFACGTIAGCNTRRYHGLLVGSLNPPANRIVAISNCHETLTIENREVVLGCFEFDEKLPDTGSGLLTEFSKDIGAHFDYDLGPVRVTKSIYLLPDSDIVAMVYDFSDIETEFDFQVRPLVAMRDFHSLRKSQEAPLFAVWRDYGVAVKTPGSDTGRLFLQTDQMSFVQDEQWWYNLLYRKEKERGQDYLEDLWSPGLFRRHVDSPVRIVLWAGLSPVADTDQVEEFDLDIVLDSLILKEKELTKAAGRNDEYAQKLYSAAGQFVVERQIAGVQRATILAGYPWFLDWGRDTFIALPGLLISTNRLGEAADVLKTFAQAVSEGMVPNRFDDYGGQPHYNSIDASLWFVHAAFEYLRASCDAATFSIDLLPAVRWIMESYHKGTRFGIRADSDSLITGGSEDTQLTWMDAKHNGTAFTPRHGKAVEINALWYDGLCNLADYYLGRNADLEHHYKQLAEKVRQSFARVFWNEAKGYLNDCALPDGTVDDSLRPNQIYAVSLPFSPLTGPQQKSVADVVQDKLLTPFGLRTLNKDDSRFVGQYAGDSQQRDAAYHNGACWPYLIGPFIEAYLRVNDSSKQSKRKAMRYLRPLLKHLTSNGCLGSISEIFDADQPQRPRGCFAQAWSVAEVLRAYQLITR
jgi:predicted glycogen debranching enzyme